jgi:hypothetical protein
MDFTRRLDGLTRGYHAFELSIADAEKESAKLLFIVFGRTTKLEGL